MDTYVFLVVLASAAFHASWNALLKIGLDRFLTASLIQIGAGALAVFALPFVPTPAPEAWPWIGLSALLHVGYNTCLSRAYQYGDLGQVYAIARGSAPLWVTLASLWLLDDQLTAWQLAGLGLLVIGIWLMALRKRQQPAQGPMLYYALATSVFIAGYTLSDGIGARANGAAVAYSLWLFVVNALVMTAALALVRGPQVFTQLRGHWRAGLVGGGLSMAAYTLVLWAMTQAPLALVAALRETSVVFALLIGMIWLKEHPGARRISACLVIACGVVVMKLS